MLQTHPKVEVFLRFPNGNSQRWDENPTVIASSWPPSNFLYKNGLLCVFVVLTQLICCIINASYSYTVSLQKNLCISHLHTTDQSLCKVGVVFVLYVCIESMVSPPLILQINKEVNYDLQVDGHHKLHKYQGKCRLYMWRLMRLMHCVV